MSRTFNLPAELKLFDPDFKTRVSSDLASMPRAYVKIVDIDSSETTLSTCVAFSTSITKDDLSGSFSCTIQKARDWNPRNSDYLGLLNPDKRKRIEIYYGQIIDGTTQYVRVFTGVPTKNPESYQFGGSDVIALSGVSLAYLLMKANGTYASDTLNGPSKTLVEYWLDEVGISYSLSYTDPITFTGQTIGYNSALAGMNAIKQVVGPSTEFWFDPNGHLIWRDMPTWDSDQVEFDFTQSNILTIEKNLRASKVITVAEITGSSSTASSTKEASSAMINTYGRNRVSISSGLVTTAAQAEALADDYIEEGARWDNPFNFSIILNPYVVPGSLVTITDSQLADISKTNLRVNSISHSYQAGTSHITQIEAYEYV